MTYRLIAAALFAVITAAPAFADTTDTTPPAAPTATAPAKKAGAQQQKMKDCNAEAKTKALKGDDRKTFMKTCLSGGADTAGGDAATTTDAVPLSGRQAQQQKMKDCNKQAKDKALKGDERKSFMSTCLKAG